MAPDLIFSMVTILCLCICGLIGNILSALILLQKSMRAPTTYFLLGLTLSDVLLLILSFLRTLNNLHPFHLHSTEELKTFIFLWDWICTSGTKYFTVAISLERCLVICSPFRARGWVTEKSAKISTLLILAFTVILSVGSFFYATYWPSYGFDVFAAVVLHFMPFLIVCVLNTIIYFGIREFQKSSKELTSADASMVALTRMLFCVVIVFGFCYSFEFVRRILNYSGYFKSSKYTYYDYTINHLADFFYVLNSSVNFVIYILMSTKFRNQFVKLVKRAYGIVKNPCGGQEEDNKTSNNGTENASFEFETTTSGR